MEFPMACQADPSQASSSSVLTRPEYWLVGGGEMSKLIRSMDWTKTPLGPIESWPQSLRTTVSLCLASNFPISLAWGPKHVQIYNDGYWPICGGKHPHSMGQDSASAGHLHGPQSVKRLSAHSRAKLPTWKISGCSSTAMATSRKRSSPSPLVPSATRPAVLAACSIR